MSNDNDISVIEIKSQRKDGKEPCEENVPGPDEDRRMMESPEYWPRWPILFLKNIVTRTEHGLPKTAVLYDREGDEGGDGPRFIFCETHTRERSLPKTANIDELIANDWIVD